MAKIRVHDLAKELGMESKELVDILKSKNIEAKGQSTLEDDVAAQIRKEAAGRKSAEKTAEKHTLEMERIRDAQKEIKEIRKEEAPEAVPAPSSASERLSRLNGMRDNGDT